MHRSRKRTLENLQPTGNKFAFPLSDQFPDSIVKQDSLFYSNHIFVFVLCPVQPCPAGTKSFRQLQCEEIDPHFVAYYHASGTKSAHLVCLALVWAQ